MESFVLRIDRLTYGGRGIGRHQGQAVFVPATAPGDLAEVRVARRHKRHLEAELLTLREPSPLRRTPPCPVADRCGGCCWQHLAEPTQRRAKEEIFRDLLQRHGGVEPTRIAPLVAAPSDWNYRRRAQLKVRPAGDRWQLGFYAAQSHTLVPVTHCPVLSSRLNDLWQQLVPRLPAPARLPALCGIDLEEGEGRCRIGLLLDTPPSDRLRTQVAQALTGLESAVVLLDRDRRRWQPLLGDPLLPVAPVSAADWTYAYPPGGFAQINREQNQAMVAAVVALAQDQGVRHLLDLYCGAGNFSWPLARAGVRITGVETHADSVAAAQLQADTLELSCRFVAGNAAQLSALVDQDTPPDALLVDPPRQGLAAALAPVVALAPAQLYYVSCDPTTLARDLAALQRAGYVVRSSRPFDFFPQTYHIESLTHLERTGVATGKSF